MFLTAYLRSQTRFYIAFYFSLKNEVKFYHVKRYLLDVNTYNILSGNCEMKDYILIDYNFVTVSIQGIKLFQSIDKFSYSYSKLNATKFET